MTRTTPDPVFTDAAREAVLDRVRSQGRDTRPRLALREVLAATLVLAAIAAVLLGIQAARPHAVAPAVSPVGPSIVATPSPSATPSSTSLVGPPAARIRTDAQIRRWAAGVGATAVWTDQRVLITRCMAQHGFLFDPVEQYTADLRAGHSGMTAADEQRWDVALNGPATTGAYDWRTAGCDGLAVHQTGQDGAS